MIKDYAKFSATVAKGIKVGDTEVEIKLLLPLRVMQENFLFLSSNQGEKINVFMGDPQAAFDFDEEDGDIFREVTGRRVITDSSGVVVDIGKREEKDPNQGTLFGQEGEGIPTAEASEVDGASVTHQEDGEPDPGHANEEEDDSMEPEWLNGDGDESGSESEEDSVPSGENLTEATQDKNLGSEGDDNLEEVSKEALEAFILTNRPVYDDIEIDGTPILFPELLQERIELKKTWKEIAQEKGISPSVLSTKYGTYKKRVEKK